MRSAVVCRVRGAILRPLFVVAMGLFVLFSGVPVSGQTTKPMPKAGPSTKPVANPKSKDGLPAIPGLPPNMPAAMRESIIKQLQQ